MRKRLTNIEKLKRLRVYKIFIRNINSIGCGDAIRYLSYYGDDGNFYEFILGAFLFLETPEGSAFWWNISKRYKNK